MRNSVASLFILMIFPLMLSAQDRSLNQVVENKETGEQILVGPVTIDGFSKLDDFHDRYEDELHAYKADMREIMPNHESLQESKITIILATWCPDTKKQLPRFIKILESIGYPLEEITMIAVDREMQAKGINVEEKYDLKAVPTFIFSTRRGKEYGRIVEKPSDDNRLETEIQELFKSQAYDDARSETGEE